MKEVLFLNGKYVTSISELRKMINNNPSLEEELVSSCKDKVLVNWMRSQDLNQWKEKNWKNREEEMILDVLEYSDTQVDKEDVSSVVESLNNLETESLSGIRLFGELHKKITGKECGNLDSSFGSFAQLVFISYGNKTYEVKDRRVTIPAKFDKCITFEFNTLKRNDENVNLILIAIGEDDVPIPSISHSMARMTKVYDVNETFQMTFSAKTFQKNEKISEFELRDEKGNTICEIYFLNCCGILTSREDPNLKLQVYETEGCYCCVVKWDYEYLKKNYLQDLPDLSDLNNKYRGFTYSMIQDLKESLSKHFPECDFADRDVARRLFDIGVIDGGTVAYRGKRGFISSSVKGKDGKIDWEDKWKNTVEYVAFSFDGNPFV